MNKQCSKCKEIKDIENFSKESKGKNGLRSYCKACASALHKKDKAENPEKFKVRQRNYLANNKNKITESNKKYLNDNLEKVRLFKSNWKKRNPNYEKNKKKTDIQYMLRAALRTRVSMSISGGKKKCSAVKDLGCSVEFLKKYLEDKFQEGMTWNNYGLYGWHIDHIIPLSMFDLTKDEDFKKACHFSNLQPLWAIDNLKKGNKIEELNRG